MSTPGEAIEALASKLQRIHRLDPEDLATLRRLPVRIERVPRSTLLIREGERPDNCCLLVSGFACRYKEAATGLRQIVSFHLKGDLLDIQHLLLARADHSVEAITDAEIAWLPKAELAGLAWERPAVGRALWRDCLIDASIFREWVLNVGRRDGKTRIAHMLCEFVARCGAAGLGAAQGFVLPMTQEQIADAVGLTAVHVNRCLRALDGDRVVVRNGAQFRVTDWQRLCTIGDFDPAYLHNAA